jgi:hypothetical protein
MGFRQTLRRSGLGFVRLGFVRFVHRLQGGLACAPCRRLWIAGSGDDIAEPRTTLREQVQNCINHRWVEIQF